ncbi:MAG TPA: hypothetical protein VEZ20_09025 [Allosphingosinicella sp.]|nr:hypothetical protein [Allosphingosinicella sp.]
MTKTVQMTLAAGAVFAIAAVALGAFGTPANAQKSDAQAKTPSNWSYEIRNGRRVPRGNRVTAADGSWREELRDGACTTVRTMSSSGEYRETRQCD